MAKSSIHIQAGKIGFFSHNSREKKTVNAIFNDESNFISCDNKTAIEKFRSELKIRTFKYLQNHPTRKKLHSKTLTHLSAIVNFNKNHTPQDIKKVCDYLEKTLDTKVIQFAMHRDEGHINSKSEAIKNYHAHIEFMGLDSQGNSIRRKLDRKYLINLQSEVANILNMQRGKNYTLLKEPRPKRLDTYPYKRKKEREDEIVKIANKIIDGGNLTIRNLKEDKKKLKDELEELKKSNNQLRAELKDYDLLREDWKKQEDLNKQLQAELKENKIDLATALEQIEELKKEILENKELKEKVNELENVIQEKNEELDHHGYREKLQENKSLRKEVADLNKALFVKEEALLEKNEEIDYYKSRLKALEQVIDFMKHQNNNKIEYHLENNLTP